MKRYVALSVVVLLSALGSAQADGPDDVYLSIYNMIQEADSLNNSAQPEQARAKYLQAQTALRAFQSSYPAWNAGVVSFRLDYIASKIPEVSGKVPMVNLPSSSAANPGDAANVNPPSRPAGAPSSPSAAGRPESREATAGSPNSGIPSSAAAAQPTKIAAPDDWQDQFNNLKKQVSRLQTEKDQLQTERTQLQADKGLLEAKLKEALSMQSAAQDADLARARERITTLEREQDSLKVALDKEKKTASEKEARQVATKPSKDDKAGAALRVENQLLKKQLADLKAASPAKDKAGELDRQLAQAQAQIALLQSQKEIMALEKSALQNSVRQLSSPAGAGALPPAAATNWQRGERDDLQKRLEAANKELNSRKSKAVASRVAALENQLANVRARLDVYEARQVPYTAEELALFKRPEPSLPPPDSKPDKKSVRNLSPSAANLVVEARRQFSSGQYDKAEDNYLQVLREDQKNVPALANLAAIQIERNHLDAAETNITQAVALNPDDAYSLSVLGNLRFRQGKYNEALDALSCASKLDPTNAEIQNYLGLTFSEKGMRGPAETALRKAIQIEPGYGSAHNNLAVVYITQQPPAVELARWHYQKALAAGHPRNPELEKMLDSKGH